MMASPLMAGNDVAHMDETTRSILLNKEVIAVDQDALGVQGHRVVEGRRSRGLGEAARRRREGAAAVQSRRCAGDDPRDCGTARLAGEPAREECATCGRTRTLPRWAGAIEATVEPHGVAMFRIEP